MTRWTGVYADSWQQEDLVPTAFSHPAKVSKGLSFRIIQHLIRQGYLAAGQTCLDPFAGVGGFGLACLAAGLRYVGVELEPRFVDCANGYACDGQPGPLPNVYTPQAPLPTTRCGQTLTHEPHTVLGNLELWRRRYGFTGATVVQGDSRQLRTVLAGAGDGVCSSPPYNLPMSQSHNGRRGDMRGTTPSEPGAFVQYGTTPGQLEGMRPGTEPQVLAGTGVQGVVGSPPFCQSDNRGNRTEFDTLQAKVVRDGKGHGGKLGPSIGQDYGTTPGQLGAMKAGPQGVVSSPPYVRSVHDGNGIDPSKLTGNPAGRHSQAKAEGYGREVGQLGAMPAGSLEAVLEGVQGVVGSPPYIDSINAEKNGIDWSKTHHGSVERKHGQHPHSAHASGVMQYGTSPGQLGNAPDTFWSAAAAILQELWHLLPPGGDHAPDGKGIDFCHCM